VSVRVVPAERTPPATASYLLSVHGGDRPRIVSSVTGVLAAVGGNITDLSTRLVGDLYVLTAEVDLPGGTDEQALLDALHEAAAGLGVKATLSPLDSDDL
jgi:glycine cleavage system transcriptional repressor